MLVGLIKILWGWAARTSPVSYEVRQMPSLTLKSFFFFLKSTCTSCLWWSDCAGSAAAAGGPAWPRTSRPGSPASPRTRANPAAGTWRRRTAWWSRSRRADSPRRRSTSRRSASPSLWKQGDAEQGKFRAALELLINTFPQRSSRRWSHKTETMRQLQDRE